MLNEITELRYGNVVPKSTQVINRREILWPKQRLTIQEGKEKGNRLKATETSEEKDEK
jgi:hypothetical protein